MQIVLFGASGFIGEAVCRAAVDAGHGVVGIVRSQAGAERVRATGATPLLATLAQVHAWRAAVREAYMVARHRR